MNPNNNDRKGPLKKKKRANIRLYITPQMAEYMIKFWPIYGTNERTFEKYRQDSYAKTGRLPPVCFLMNLYKYIYIYIYKM